MVALLAASGAFFLLLGLHEVLLATRDDEQVVGGVLTVAGAALLAAAHRIRHPRQPWLLYAALAVGAVGGLTLAAVQAGFQDDRRMWIWGALTAIPVTAALLYRGRRAAPPSGEARVTRHSRTEAAAPYAAGATVVAALITLAGDAFRPVSGPDALYVDMTMSAAGTRTGEGGEQVAVVGTTVEVSNRSSERLTFLGGAYAVSGVMPTARSPSGSDEWPFLSELSQSGRTGRFQEPHPYDAIEVAFDVVTPGRYLEPGQSVTLEWLTPVPTATYDTVEGWVIIASAYEDRMRLGEQCESVRRRTDGARELFESSWTIEPTGWIAGLTRGHRTLSVEYYVDRGRTGAPTDAATSGSPVTGVGMSYRIDTTPRVAVGPSSDRPNRYSARVADFYGAAATVAEATTALGVTRPPSE